MRKLLIILVILAAFQSCKKETALEVTDTQLSHNNDVLTNGSWRRLADYPGSRTIIAASVSATKVIWGWAISGNL